MLFAVFVPHIGNMGLHHSHAFSHFHPVAMLHPCYWQHISFTLIYFSLALILCLLIGAEHQGIKPQDRALIGSGTVVDPLVTGSFGGCVKMTDFTSLIVAECLHNTSVCVCVTCRNSCKSWSGCQTFLCPASQRLMLTLTH